ncbi:MAG: hypothetical protein ABFS30_10230 [Pseudomonadota bacterium]
MAGKKAAKEESAPPAREPKGVEVRLKKIHAHQGIDYAVGETITVTEQQAGWLRARGII